MYKRPLQYSLLLFLLFFTALVSAQPQSPFLGQVLIVDSDGNPAGTLVPNLDTPRGTALSADGSTFFVSVTGGLGSAGGGVVLIVDTATGVASECVADVTPFDLEVDPASGNLFVSDATGGVLNVPVDIMTNTCGTPITGPNSTTPGVFVDTFTIAGDVSGTTFPVIPSGGGFAPNGDFFSGLQSTDPSLPGNAGLLQIDVITGTAVQVGILDTPFDVQVDSAGNVFVNNVVPGDTVGGSAGEIAFFVGLGAVGSMLPPAPLVSETFAPVAIRGLAIGPVGSAFEDVIFASTGSLNIVTFPPFDPMDFDNTFTGDIFAGPPVSDIMDPFAFDIQFLPGGDFQLLISVDPIINIPVVPALQWYGLAGLGLIVVMAGLWRRRQWR